MKSLSTAATVMPRSGIRVILDLAVRIPDAIHLEIGQPDFVTPDHIIDAAVVAMRQGHTKYTPNAGLWSLREAIAQKVTRENHIPALAEQIVVTTGGMGGLFSAAAAVLDPGDEILVPDPGYPNYEMMAILCKANAVRYPLTDPYAGFLPDWDTLERQISPRTKALVVNSPSNPTGSIFPRAVTQMLFAFAQRHDLYVISDECYEKIIFDAEHVSPAQYDTDGRVISVFSFSKTYAMTGWRVGYTVSTAKIAAVISKLQEATVACTSVISQKAAEAALAGSQECVSMMNEQYRKRRDLVVDMLGMHGISSYVPQGAFYLLVDVSKCGIDSEDFARQLLAQHHVAVAPGRTFGALASRYIRISQATSEANLEKGIGRLCQFIQHNSRK